MMNLSVDRVYINVILSLGLLGRRNLKSCSENRKKSSSYQKFKMLSMVKFAQKKSKSYPSYKTVQLIFFWLEAFLKL